MNERLIKLLDERCQKLEEEINEKDMTNSLLQSKLDLALEKNDELNEEIESLKEQIKLIVDDRDDNYRRIEISSQIDFSNRW